MRIPIILLCLISIVISACKKDDVSPQTTENVNSVSIDKYLSLHPVKKAYYNDSSNRYEMNQFTSAQTEFNYSLDLTAGNKYRVLLYGFPMSNVNLELRDANENVIEVGEQANVGFTAKFYVFETTNITDYHIHIDASTSTYYNQNFFLTFEEIGTYSLNWKGHNWICDGDWEINGNDQLVHRGHNSGFSKYAKLSDQYYTSAVSTVEFVAGNAGLSSLTGIAVNASDEIFEMINLPAVCRLFRLTGSNSYVFWTINNGVGNFPGTLSQPMIPGLNQLECSVQSDSIRYSLNGVPELARMNDNFSSHRVYLSVEDTGIDSVIINDFTIN